MNCSISTFMPHPTARRAVPSAAVVLPLPGPVLIRISPRRDDGSEFIADSSQFIVLSSRFTASESCAQIQLRTKNCELRTCTSVVRVARENCTGPVELLGHHE